MTVKEGVLNEFSDLYHYTSNKMLQSVHGILHVAVPPKNLARPKKICSAPLKIQKRIAIFTSSQNS